MIKINSKWCCITSSTSAVSETLLEEQFFTSCFTFQTSIIIRSSTNQLGPEIDLKNEELTIVNKVIKELSHLNGKQIGEYSLRDYPVKRTEEDEIIDYDLTFSRKSNNHDKVYVKIS